MTKFLLCGAAAATLLAGGAALAQTTLPGQPGKPAGGRHGHMMKTETRADVQARSAKLFARLDTNRDGYVTKAEVDALQAEHAAKVQQRASRFDPAKMFDRLDANHDGQITQAEIDAAHAARAAKHPGMAAGAGAHHGGAGMFARADSNKDGVVTRAEFDAAAAQMHARMEKAGMHRGFAGQMFDMADTNKDGRVSLAEAQALALQHFDRADLNHDGTLTPDERQQARQLMRTQRHPS